MEITDAISPQTRTEFEAVCHPTKDWWKDIGRSENTFETNRKTLNGIAMSSEGKAGAGLFIVDRMEIAGTIMTEESAVVGLEIIGEGFKIGPNTYIGPQTGARYGCYANHEEVERFSVANDARMEVRCKL